jgi:hypothetical protein
MGHLATARTTLTVALARRKLGGDPLDKGGSLPRTGTDFPEVPLPRLGLAILSDLDAFARDLGVRR